MDVELPDGTILEGVPEGTTRAQIEAKLGRSFGEETTPATPPPRKPMSAGKRFVRGMAEPVIGVGQNVAHLAAMLPVDALKDNAATYDDFSREFLQDSAEGAPPGLDIARIGGNIASPLTAVPAGRVAAMTRGAPLLRRAAVAAPVGAAVATTTPTEGGPDFAQDKAAQATIGAAVGPVAEGVGSVAARVARPSAEATALHNEGVRLTTGQLLGGYAKSAEDIAQGLPIIGGGIRGARQRATESMNVAMGNRVLAPIGQSLPRGTRPGREMVQEVERRVGRFYDDVLSRVQFRQDPQFGRDFARIRQAVQQLPNPEIESFNRVVMNEIRGRMDANGRLTGEAFKAAESELSTLANRLRASTSYGDRQLSRQLVNVRDALRNGLVRSNPQHGPRLQQANRAWEHFSRLRDASGAPTATGGVFNPNQLRGAVRANDKRGYKLGRATDQDLSDAATAVMGEGRGLSALERILLNVGTLGAGAVYAPQALVGLAGGAAAYSQPGQYLLRQLAAPSTPTVQRLAEQLARIGPVQAVPPLMTRE